MPSPDENEAVGNDDAAPDESSVTPAADESQDGSETDATLDDPPASPASDVSQDDAPDDAQAEEPDDAQRPSRLQRILQHPAFMPALAIVGRVASIGFSAWREARSVEADDVVDTADEFQETDDDSDCQKSRKSPAEHIVSGYTRTQHYGPGNEETKTVNIDPYTRGVAE